MCVGVTVQPFSALNSNLRTIPIRCITFGGACPDVFKKFSSHLHIIVHFRYLNTGDIDRNLKQPYLLMEEVLNGHNKNHVLCLDQEELSSEGNYAPCQSLTRKSL